jgi:hypothetical protein
MYEESKSADGMFWLSHRDQHILLDFCLSLSALPDCNLSGDVSGLSYNWEPDYGLLWQGNDFSVLYQQSGVVYHPKR